MDKIKIVNYNPEKGYGFVLIQGRRCFIHCTSISPRPKKAENLNGVEVFVVETVVTEKGTQVKNAFISMEGVKEYQEEKKRTEAEDFIEKNQEIIFKEIISWLEKGNTKLLFTYLYQEVKTWISISVREKKMLTSQGIDIEVTLSFSFRKERMEKFFPETWKSKKIKWKEFHVPITRIRSILVPSIDWEDANPDDEDCVFIWGKTGYVEVGEREENFLRKGELELVFLNPFSDKWETKSFWFKNKEEDTGGSVNIPFLSSPIIWKKEDGKLMVIDHLGKEIQISPNGGFSISLEQ
jgi:cold shock CspA family protein